MVPTTPVLASPARFRKSRLALGLGCVAVGFGIWGFTTRVVGEHVTVCGMDAQGVYAKVRVNNLLGGAHDQTVEVVFSVRDGYSYESGVATAHVAAHGYGTAVVREHFPRHVADPSSDDAGVEGRRVYRYYSKRSTTGKLVTKEFAEKHPVRSRTETVPDDPSILRCSVEHEDEGD